MMNKFTACLIALTGFAYILKAQDPVQTNKAHNWQIITTQGEPVKREDCGFVEANKQFYLIGGRGIKSVDVFDPKTNSWIHKNNTPFEMHHFQAVTYKNQVYIIGGMAGGYPHEKPLENIYIYNFQKDEWQKGPAMPPGRLRGSGGTVVYNNKIYLIGGIRDGHFDGTVSWMDEFNPETGSWKTLPDAPRGRDHFHAVVIDKQLYLAGGRRTSAKTNEVIQLTIPEVDVFDFKTQTWKTLPASQDLPALRAGCTAVAWKQKLVVIGGESITQKESHHEAEAFDPKTGSWTKLANLVTGRHDTGALSYKNKIYIAAGAANRGGGPDQSTIEVLTP
jgi:N-acetylneuraminic acid mutarotase